MIERLMETGQLASLTPSDELTAVLLAQAARAHAAGELLAASHPEAAYGLAHESLRKTLTAFLNCQGLRPTSTQGHHAVVIEAVDAQIGHVIGGLISRARTIRTTRNALEYPTGPVSVDADQARDALATAFELHRGVTVLVNAGEVPLFR